MAALLGRFLADGDEGAMEELVSRTRPRLLATARRIAGSDEAEDVVQTAFHSLLRKGAVPEGRLAAWLTTAAVRIAYRHRAKRLRQHELATRLAHARPHDAVDAADVRILRTEVARLPDRFRDPVVLHYLEGLKTPEVARLLDLSEAAVRQRLCRARKLLRGRLSPRLGYALALLPWLLADTAQAATVAAALGGVMKKKAALVAMVVVLAAGGGYLWRSARNDRVDGSATERATRPDARAASVDAPDETDAPEETTAKDAALPFASGVVVDATMAPLPGVSIVTRGFQRLGALGKSPAWFYKEDVLGASLAKTDGEGRFEVRTRPAELHSLVFFKSGYLCVERAKLSEDPAANQDLRIVLAAGRVFSGVVTDKGGQPLHHVKVAAWPGNTEHAVAQHTLTGDDGRFRFDTLGAPAMAMVAGEGYETQMLQNADGEHTITLVRNSLVIDVVDAETGAPVDAAAVLLRDNETVFVCAARRTGRIQTFTEIPGRLVLQASFVTRLRKTKVIDGIAWIFAPGYVSHREPVRLEQGVEPPHVRVRLARGDEEPSLAGRVTGPETDITVELRAMMPEGFLDGGDAQRTLLLSQDAEGGRFAFPRLPDIKFRLIARAPGHAPGGVYATPPDRDVVIPLQPACTLTVTSVDRAGKPRANSWVHVESSAAEARHWHAQADADGVATFDTLPPGEARVWPYRYDAVMPDMFPAFGKATLRAGEPKAVRVEPIPLIPVDLVVIRSDDTLVAGATITLSGGRSFDKADRDRTAALRLTTDPRGRAPVELVAGGYRAKITTKDGTTLSRSFSVEVGTGEAELVLPARGTAVIAGRVVESGSGAALASRPVYVSYHDGRKARGWIAQTVTAADGTYRIAGLPAARLDIHVSANAGPDGGLNPSSPFASLRRTVDLDASETKTIDWKVPRLKGEGADRTVVELRVRVTDDAGRPILGATVFASGLRDHAWASIGSFRTEKDGRTTGRLIDAERYSLFVYGPFEGRKQPFRSRRVEAEVVDGRVEMEIALEPQ